jgi:serine/threonine protein kinase
MIEKTLDHCRMLGKVGEGGMGVVYGARDEVLNRDVALKLLSEGAVNKVAPVHLLRETQTASSLNHPNICTIHRVGETSGDFYVVMELKYGHLIGPSVETL